MKKFLVGLIIFIIIWLAILMQINFFNVITLAGTAANIGIVVIVSLGLFCGDTVGGVVGFIYGLLNDILMSKAIGIYILSYMLLGYITGKIGKDFSKENRTTMIIMTGIGTLLFEIFSYVLKIMFYNYDFSLIVFLIMIFKQILYNMIIAIFLFKPITFLAEIINKAKNNYYLL